MSVNEKRDATCVWKSLFLSPKKIIKKTATVDARDVT